MARVALFAYGTLRPGRAGWNRMGGEVRRPILGCTTQGRIYNHGYPVAKFDEEGIIVGDILFFDDDSREWHGICSMEEGAGYEIRKITVTVPDGKTFEVYGWHYKYRPHGPLIPSGDFMDVVNSRS